MEEAVCGNLPPSYPVEVLPMSDTPPLDIDIGMGELNQPCGVGYFYHLPPLQHHHHQHQQLLHHSTALTAPHQQPQPEKPRPNRAQMGFSEEEDVVKRKAEMDASFLHSLSTHLANPPFYFTSSSDCSDDSARNTEEPTSSRRPKQKRRKRFESFFESLMTQVIQKQERMHQQLMDVIERKDRERILREEAWRRQEIERAQKEQQIRSQEASRSLALISFIRNALGQDVQIPQPSAFPDEDDGDSGGSGKSDQDKFDPNNKRWPSSEVQALITVRAILDSKFHIPTLKTPAWEEVSTAMAGMGFHRTPKKCKEKWENINKYYKKASASGKKRSENAKPCPYFHELEALYSNRLITNSRVASPATELAEETANE